MAKYWIGGSPAVAQESRATPANVEINDVFSLLVGGVTIASFTATGATVANVTAGLTTAWNNSTHPYATGITASDQTTYVKLLADTAGVPFTITATATNGGATNNQTLTMSTPTASAGPNDWSTAANWSSSGVPGNGEVVYIAGATPNICWGLGQSAVELTALHVLQSYTGRIGLEYERFATNSAATTFDATAPEYRTEYLTIGTDGASESTLGVPDGPSGASGSGRIKCKFVTDTVLTVHNTATTPTDAGRPAVRVLCDGTLELTVVYAPGGVGIATEHGGETTTVGTLRVTDTSSATQVICGPGTAVSNWHQDGGINVLRSTGTVVKAAAFGGRLTTLGNYTITSLENYGATINCRHSKTGGNAVTAARLAAGTTDAYSVGRAVTWGSVTRYSGAAFAYQREYVTISTDVQESGVYSGSKGTTPQQV